MPKVNLLFRKHDLLLGVIACLLGFFVLMGWELHVPAQTEGPGLAIMRPNTALALLLSGAGLVLLTLGTRARTVRYAVVAIGYFVASISVLTLLEHLFGWELLIDQMVFKSARPVLDASHSFRMSPATAYSFVLIGSALALSAINLFQKFRRPLVMALAIAAHSIGVLALIGIVTDAYLHYRWWNYTGMAIHTALGVICLSQGLIARIRREQSFEWSLGTIPMAGFMAGIVLMLTATGFAFNSTRAMLTASQWVSHTQEVLKELREILAGMDELESGQRGYLILGDEHLLDARDEIKKGVEEDVEQVRQLTSDNPRQQSELLRLDPLIKQRNIHGDDSITIRRRVGFQAAQQMLSMGGGIKLTASINQVLKGMEREEERLLVIRLQVLHDISTVAFLMLPLGVFLSVTLLFIGLFFLNSGIAERKRAERSLHETQELHHQTDRRMAEIVHGMTEACFAVDANWHFTFVNDQIQILLHHTREQMLGRSLWDVFSKLVGTPMETHYRRAMRERLPVVFEAFSPIADRWLDIRLFPSGDGLAAFLLDIHERKTAEQALRDIQGRLQSTLLAGSIGTWTWDIARDCLIADEFTARMFSLDVAAAAKGLPAKAYLQAVLKEDQAEVSANLSRAIQSCGQYDIEYRVPQKDAGLQWLQARGRVDADAAGNAVRFHGAIMNITERKRTEARFRRLVDSSAQGVLFWNSKGEITGANDAFLHLVGHTRQDLESGRLNWSTMTPPEYSEVDQRNLIELRTKGICAPFEKEYLHKDGTRVPILMGAATFEDNPEEGVCFLIDITERKRTDKALRESEEHFRFLNDLSERTRALSDPAQIMAMVAQMLGEHLHASRCAYADVENDGDAFTILHDYTNRCASTVGTYKLSLFGARAAAALSSGETLIINNVDTELLTDDGADMFNAIGIKAIIWCPLVKDGSLRAMMAVHQVTPRKWQPREIAIVRDVVERCWATIERRNSEEKVHQLNVDLERRVTERTAQLEDANKELEAFSYSVSHDLRAPLRAVDGFSRAVLEDFGPQLPADGQEYLQCIRQSAQQMGHLIDDLLSFSRLSRAPLRKSTVDLHRIVIETLEDMQGQLKGRQINFNIAALPPCQGDGALLKQVWINLLSNAVKYTSKRPLASIEVGWSEELSENVYFIRDNGTGFDMRYADKLFGVFQRLHRAEDYDGTGVGLAIVQRVITRHGGRIWADAAVDHGATFYFTLEERRS